MDYNRAKEDTKGLETATIMRDDYQNLVDTIINSGENYVPTKNEVLKLLAGAMIITSQLQDKLSNLRIAIKGYEENIIPKLQEIADNAKNDEEAKKLANEKFAINI